MEIRNIVNFIVETEFEQFLQDYEKRPIPHSQDVNTLSIAWLCYYCKEVISPKNRKSIQVFVDKKMEKDNYHYDGWMKLPAMQAALYSGCIPNCRFAKID